MNDGHSILRVIKCRFCRLCGGVFIDTKQKYNGKANSNIGKFKRHNRKYVQRFKEVIKTFKQFFQKRKKHSF